MIRSDIRNLCIIAHVDHGKTTLVDFLLKQAGLFAAHEKIVDRMMDSNDLEREKGITIMAKNASIQSKGVKINLVDTPGHADFGGEVERILGTVDGAILLVDAAEGPLPQTRFVLEKALQKGHRIILCINKVDRPEVQGDTRRISEVIDHTFSLFVELGATDKQCDFPIVYACAREGWCTTNLDEVPELVKKEKTGSLEPLFDLILNYLPPPTVDADGELRMQLSSLAWSDYVGRLAIGRVLAGKVKRGQTLFRLGYDDDTGAPMQEKFQAVKVFIYDGVKQVEVEELTAGDIGIIAGCDEVHIGDTLAGSDSVERLSSISIDPPTLRMIFTINSSPMSGREGEAMQSRKLRERLLRECRANVALKFQETENPDQFYLLGRGELQFAILIETMRREGSEFMVGRPIVLMKEDEKGNTLEPIETAVLDLPEAFSGDVTAQMQERKGVLTLYENLEANRIRLTFEIPSRGLLGIRSRYLTLTRGEGLFNSKIKEYQPYKGDMHGRKNGTLIADRSGKTTDYALSSLEERGVLFIGQGVEVYEGMIIGECSKENDMNVNPVRPKKLTNIRTTSSEGIIILSGIRKMSLEECIEWIDEDEWIEVTPETVRIRKKELNQNKRTVIRTIKKK